MSEPIKNSEQLPVAWIEHHKGGDNLNWEKVNYPYAKATPLYTHPQRELTDEEILDAMFLNDTDLMGLLEMMPSVKEKMIQRGRALLKKASEK